MRKVDRTGVNAPTSIDVAGSAGVLELAAARAHVAAGSSKSFKFAAYKKKDVAAALEELFLGKCAYCESTSAAVAPYDVEHFRPKGKVEECPSHPGYWWLAASWTNLLLSCIDCNRHRGHTIFQVGATVEENLSRESKVSGKGNSFPIMGPAYAQQEADDADAELPALIDPTRTDPSVHLTWVSMDDISLVAPRTNGGAPDVRGFATMHVFGLNRQGLVEQRTALLLRLRKETRDIERLLDIAVRANVADGDQLLDMVWEMLSDLYALSDPCQPYSAMVSDFLHAEQARLDAKYAAMLHLAIA